MALAVKQVFEGAIMLHLYPRYDDGSDGIEPLSLTLGITVRALCPFCLKLSVIILRDLILNQRTHCLSVQHPSERRCAECKASYC